MPLTFWSLVHQAKPLQAASPCVFAVVLPEILPGKTGVVGLGDIEQRILSACLEKAQSTPDMLVLLGYGNRTGNLKKALSRLRTIGFLELTIPGKPRSKNQRYRLTAKGRQAMASATAN